MRRDSPFFLSDPRPEDWQEADDPRPEDWQEADDPRPEDWQEADDPRPEDWQEADDPRPEDWQEADDPRPEDWQEADDPRPEDWQEADDPRPEDWQEADDPRPEDWQEADDPAVRKALRLLRRRRPRRGRGRRCRPSRRRRQRFRFQYSGRVVVRLSSELDLPSLDDVVSLRTVGLRLELGGLRRVLKAYRISSSSTGRLVDVDFKELPLEYGCAAARGQQQQSPKASGERSIPVPQPQTRATVWELERQAATAALPPLHSLAAYWRIDVADQPRSLEPAVGELRLNGWTPSHERSVQALVRELNELPEVDLAYRELAVSDPAPEPGDVFAVVQEYLDRAPIGIGAQWFWKQGAPLAEGICFVDLEQGWIRQEDLGGLDPDQRLIHGDNRDGEGAYRGHHGTAVLGQVIGEPDNRLGIRGVAGEARVVLLASHYDKQSKTAGDVANAIRQAIGWMKPGDVLLLEVQRSYLPTEVDPLDLDAIRLAVSRGITVIEAAGNGNANLDHYVDEEGRRLLARRHPDYRESGALVVAAARTAPPHNRLAGRAGVGSNHGRRIDCFAHGDRVVTTGYGDLNGYLEDGPAEPMTAYTSSFGGTSGAAPIIAGAALLVQGVHRARTGSLLSPWEMRRLLSDPATGTRQGRGVRGRIGVMPDLRRIVRDRLGLVSQPYLRDHPHDDGTVPADARTASSPDIAVTTEEKPPDQFDDAYPGAGALEAGKPHSIFVRVRNRGVAPVEQLDLRLYWSPVATLVTPDLWREIEGTSEVTLSADPAAPAQPLSVQDLPVWTSALAWTPQPPEPSLASDDGKQARYCFAAIVTDARDNEIVEPPNRWPYFDWRRYQAFLRWHNGVACRNVHVVESGAGALPFLLTGTPDAARVFDLEILRCLPPGTRVALSTHPAVASALRRFRLWDAAPDAADPSRVRLALPTQTRLLVQGVRLVAGARFPCRFTVEGPAGEGHSLAIRQLYRGREVGRITWLFRG